MALTFLNPCLDSSDISCLSKRSGRLSFRAAIARDTPFDGVHVA
jgi:hypothetical protein